MAGKVYIGRASKGIALIGTAQVLIRGFVIDVTISEDHTFDSEVTEFPVESGSTISDNVRPKPITLSMDGIVSNSPIGSVRQQRAVSAPSASNSLFSTIGAAALTSSGAGDGLITPTDDDIGNPAAEAYQLLQEVRTTREPVTVVTTLDVFDNMVMIHLSIPRKPGNGAALEFSATFQQVEIVTNNRVRVAIRGSGSGKSNKGTAPVIPIVASVIKWRHGVPPGGDAINLTTRVLYTNHHFYHLPDGNIPSAILAAQNAGGTAVAVLHPDATNASTADADLRKLSAQELADFSKDNARDTGGARQKYPTSDSTKSNRPPLTPDQLDGGDNRTIAKGKPMIPLSNVSQNPNKPKPTPTKPQVKVGKPTRG